MKRKFADRRDWKRILKKTYRSIFIREKSFEGYVSFLTLEQVKAALRVRYDKEEFCIADDGYVWMQHFPMELDYVLTSVYDNTGQAVQWYFDIVKHIGTTRQGIPYFDDLYLDVVLLPGGGIHLLDEDELQDALDRSVVSQTEYLLAHNAASKVIHELRTGKNYLINNNYAYFQFLKQLQL